MSESEREEALLPCPFCGSSGSIHDDHGTYEPGCRHCGISIGAYSSARSAAAAWNRRQSAPQREPVAWRKIGADGNPMYPMYLTAIPFNDPTAMIAGGWEALYLCAFHPAQPDADAVQMLREARAWFGKLSYGEIALAAFVKRIDVLLDATDAALQSAKPEGK